MPIVGEAGEGGNGNGNHSEIMIIGACPDCGGARFEHEGGLRGLPQLRLSRNAARTSACLAATEQPASNALVGRIFIEIARLSRHDRPASGGGMGSHRERPCYCEYGYNGAPRGVLNCADINRCARKELNVPSGERYELCEAVHAEQNAIVNGAPERMKDATIYIAGFEENGDTAEGRPCLLCSRMILNAQLMQVVYLKKDGSICRVDDAMQCMCRWALRILRCEGGGVRGRIERPTDQPVGRFF